jgi:hypothetical protein
VNRDELQDYINRFPEYQRDMVYKAILDSELLADAFNTSAGKLIMNNAVDKIAVNVAAIARACFKKDFDPQEVLPIAYETNLLYGMLKEWATILKKPDMNGT